MAKTEVSSSTTLNISDEVEAPPPSSATDSDPSPPTDNDVEPHPVIKIMQDKELGKTAITIAIPIAMGTVAVGKDKLAQSEVNFILILTTVGFAALFNGILLKDTYPKTAQIVEAVGIVAVAISFFSVVSFFLPAELSWVPVICIGLSLLPFATAVWQSSPT